MPETTNNWVNFAEIRARVSLEDVLVRYYQITTLKRDGPKLVGPCPVHNGDSPRAFHADLDRNVWHCFSKCKKGGNQLDLVAAKEGIPIRDAALRLQAHFLGTPGAKPAGAAKPPSTPPPATTTPTVPATPAGASPKGEEPEGNPALDIKLDLKSDHPHLIQDRGLQLATTQHFGLGYCARGIMKGMIGIPVHDEEGTLVAYAGRRLKFSDIREFGKYKFPKGFKKELVLYNLNRARAHLPELGYLIVVEGFFTVAKLFEHGFPNVVAVMGSDVSKHQARLLTEAKEVVILFDGDDAGWGGALLARELLARDITVRLGRLPKGAEPESLSPKALRWLVNGLRQLDLAEVSFAFPAPTTPAATTPPTDRAPA